MNKSQYNKVMEARDILNQLMVEYTIEQEARDRDTDHLEYEEAFRQSRNGLIQCGHCNDIFNLRVNKQCPDCGCQQYVLLKGEGK